MKVCWIRSISGLRRSRKLHTSAHDAYSLAFAHVSESGGVFDRGLD